MDGSPECGGCPPEDPGSEKDRENPGKLERAWDLWEGLDCLQQGKSQRGWHWRFRGQGQQQWRKEGDQDFGGQGSLRLEKERYSPCRRQRERGVCG